MVRIYRRDGWFYVDYAVNGRRRRRALRTQDPKAADLLRQKYEAQLLEARLRGGLKNDRVMIGLQTLSQLVTAYREWAKSYYSDSEYVVQGYALDTLVGVRGKTLIADFGPSDLHAVRKAMLKLDWSRSTINGQISRVRHVFRWGVERELVPGAVYEALKSVAGLRRGEGRDTQPIGPVPDGDVLKVKQDVSPTVAAMIDIQLLTAARGGELCIMCPENIDRSGSVWVYMPRTFKGSYRGQTRHIYIGPKAQAVLRPFLFRAPSAYCFVPEGGSSKRLHYTPDVYRKAIRRACERLGVPVWKPHQLRHNAATMLRREYGIEAAQLFLGHSDADTTLVYAEADRQKIMAIAERVG